MKIRSITCFLDPTHDHDGNVLGNVAKFSSEAIERLRHLGVEVETTRLSSPPFSKLVDCSNRDKALEFAKGFQASAASSGFAYASCGPSLPDQPASEALVPEILNTARGIFVSTFIADCRFLYPRAIHSAAQTIKQASTITPDGFTNLNFAALANTRPYGPFFPGSYAAAGEKPAYSLAIECADAVVTTFGSNASLPEMRENLLATLNEFAHKVSQALNPLGYSHDVEFKGFDFSPAPFPEPGCSLGGGIEALGVELGKTGALAAASILAHTLNSGRWKHAGYNGLMMPVLEDSLLAERAAAGQLSVKDLLLYSSVCGTGLDTVPLPGDISVAELESILWDVAALAVRLGKPLTARLMPIPGKKAGDTTEFKFGYFANSRVMSVEGQQVRAPLESAEPIPLAPRTPNGHL